MSIDSLNAHVPALPYPGMAAHASLRVTAALDDPGPAANRAGGKQQEKRVRSAERAEKSSTQQRGQREQDNPDQATTAAVTAINPLLFTEAPAITPRRMPGAHLLNELIIRMGGTGDYSGPARHVNVVV